MMAKQTRKIPGIVKIIRKTEKEAVKYERAFVYRFIHVIVE